MRTTFILVAALVASSFAGPTGQRSSSSSTCALHCTDSETFTYETGKSYVYEYSVTTSTALLGTFDDEAQMHITANAQIDVHAPCEYILTLSDVSLEGSGHSAEFSDAITKNPLRFSFQDGIIENMCNEVSEPAWVLNFKRGVLSTFQNSMNYLLNHEEVRETDISGMCTTHYGVRSEGGNTLIVEKIKDLSSCTHRPDLSAYIASTSYATNSPIQNLPIFKSTNKCQQKIEEGVLKEAECEETHKFRPFSSEEGGAVTTAKTTLRLLSQQQSTFIITDFQSSINSLVFDEEPSPISEAQLDVVEDILNNLKVASEDEISPEVPALFSNLVTSLKNLNYPQLSNICTKIQEPQVKRFLIDAMPLVGTASSVGIVRDMIMNGELSESEEDAWFTSLAFVKNPNPEMLTAIAPLLEDNPRQKAMLGTSALINNYCKIYTNCESESGVIQVIRRFEAQLGSGCRAINEEQKTRILIALKALGNAGRWVNANSALRRCYTEEENSMEIRVAALEAWRHTPCEYDRSNIQAAFQDEMQDPEVRIAAYLALMSCPTPSLINTVKDKLTSEGVNQVGSFVWTHLTNMQESASPEKQWMRELIGEELLQKKFNTEALKFSRNYESSFFMNELNTGATVDSNVIFSSKSYLPRSAMLNLTLDLFGQSINFFEVGGRIEGFESYVERFFGPHGYFPEETVEGILKNMREQKTDYEPTTLEDFLDNASDEPEGSYYLRMFGNELHYHHFRGLENIMKTSGATNPLEFLMDLARKGNVDYSKSYQLFDTHFTIPTISGLPLALTAKGTATLGIQMNGNFKARSLKNVNIEGHFHPSAAVEIDGLMVVDAHVTHTGLKITSNLHTSTFLDGKIQINNGKLVDIAFNTPKEKVEVINVETKFFYLENDEEKEKDVDNKIQYEGCTKGTSGMALCGEYRYASRSENSGMVPFVGPFATHVYFKKTDTQTGYILRFARTKNEISFMMDTPGSQNDHKISVDLVKTNNALIIDIHTPFKSVQGNGEYVWQTNNKHVKLNLVFDGKPYVMDASWITNDEFKKFEPSVLLTGPAGDLMNLKGIFQIRNKSGDVGIELNTPVLDTTINSQFSYGNAFISFNTDVEYKIMKGNPQTFHQSSLVKKEISNNIGIYLVNFEFIPSEFSDFSVKLDYKTKIFHLGHIESNGKLTRGPVTWEGEQLWLYTNDNGQWSINNYLSIKCPYRDIDYLASLKLLSNRNSIQGDMTIRTAPGKDLAITASFSNNRNVELIGNVATQFGDFKAALEVQYTKIASRQHKIQIITKIRDETILLEGTLKDNSSQGKINAVVEGIGRSSVYEIKSTIGFSADKEKAAVDMKTVINGIDYTAKLEGSSSAIMIDINIIKHILLNAYVTTSEEVNKMLIMAEWDKDVDPTKSFMIDGELSSKAVKFNLKFVEKEVLLSSKLVSNGAELEAKWAPDKSIICNIYYTTGETTSLSTTVQTPFSGWEKQDATFTLSFKEYEIESRFVATWKNSEQMNLYVKANVHPGMFSNAMKANILFSSSFHNFERITFMLDHSMIDTKISSRMEGLWDDKKLNGNFQFIPNENGIEGSLSFVSWFTEDLLITLSHKLLDMSLVSAIEAKYGEDISTITMKGHVDLTNIHDVTLIFKVNTPFSLVPEINTNINYNNDGSLLKLLVDGVINGQKLMLNVNGNMTLGETTSVMGDLRFITPITYPLTAFFKHIHNAHTFTSEFEMSRIWSTYGNLKMHAEGQMISKNDIKLNAILSCPAYKGSFSFAHNVAKKMVSSIEASLNAERIYATVSGILDSSVKLVNLDGEIVSTFNGLDDIKINVKSEKNGETRTSKVIFIAGDKSINIDHIITFNDLLNWENSFKVNGKYELTNKQTHVGSGYAHELQYIWDSETVEATFRFDKKRNGSFNEINAQVSLATPWSENIKVDVLHKYNVVEYNPVLVVEYGPGTKIELSNVIKFDEAFFYIESSLMTPFWQPLGFKLNVYFQPRSAVTLVLIKGDMKTTIDAGGKYETGKLDGTLEIHSTYSSLPIFIEAAYDIISYEKTAHFVVTYDQKYEMKGSLSGNLRNAKWSLAIDIPTENVQHMEFNGEYNVMANPLSAKAIFILDSKTYEINGQLNIHDFSIDTYFDGKKGRLSGDWFLSQTKCNIQIIFESPFSTVESFSISAMYDITNEKKVNIKLTKGADEINLTGKLENETILLEGSTPFIGWETLRASFFISESAISVLASRNDRKIEVTGTMHVKPAKGNIDLTIDTPYSNFEKISVNLAYSFQSSIKNAVFKSTFGIQQILLKGTIDVTDVFAPEIKLDITTPFDVVDSFEGIANWNFKGATKTAVVKANLNDQEYHWELEATAENLFKGQAAAKIITPLSGWTSVNIEGSFDFTSVPYKFVFTFEKEETVNKFEGNINIDDNAISADVRTPVTGWEKILLIGNYSFNRNHFTLNAEITKNSEKYNLNGDFLFNTQTPKFHVILKTPISYASNIELIFNSNLIDLSKMFLISLNIDDVTYSLDFSGELVYKTGYVKVSTQTPIPGYSNVELYSKFDLTGDVKIAEIDLKKENQNQHISLAARVNDNNVFIEIHTPFKELELITLNGDYTTYNGEHVVRASFMKNVQEYNLQANILQQDNTASIKISTPIEAMKNIELSGKYKIFKEGIEGSLHFEKNNEIFNFNTRGLFTPIKSDLVVSVETPIPGWKKMVLSTHYDMQSEKKLAALFIQKDSFIKKYRFEGMYTPKSGSFKIETPVDGFEVIGAEYGLNLSERNNQLDAHIKFQLDSKEWTFSAQGEYNSNRILIRFQTPIEGFSSIVAEGNIDIAMRTGKGVIEFGTYKFTVNVSYSKDNVLFEMTTPFNSLKCLSIGARYTWVENHKDATVNLTYNDKTYSLQGTLSLSSKTSEFLLHASTPFHNFSTMTVKAKYDIDNRNELVAILMTTNTETYGFKLGGFIEEKLALLICDFTLPVSGLTNVKFTARLDLTLEDKNLEISLEKDGNIKAINISGKLIGDTMNFNLRTPFKGLENCQMFGRLNRSKRSLEFQMMNDATQASILTNFNSVKIHLKTPFAVAEEIRWEITKVDDNTLKIEWRRNDNYITIDVERQGKKNAFDVKVKSEFQGWEFLALSGKLDRETMRGYISGEINEEKVTVTGSGEFQTKGTFDLHIQTPYDNYKSVEAKLEYNSRRKTFKLEASSSSSNFHFILERDRSGILSHHSIYPNPVQPTEITVNLGLYAGKVTITSRFPSLREYYQEYHANIGPVITADHIIKLNNLEVFKMDLTRDGSNKKLNLVMHFRRTGHHTTIELHRDGYSSVHFLVSRDDKEFRIDLQGSGQLPTQGELDIDIINTFRQVPRNIKVHVVFNVARSEARKHIKVEVTPRRGRLYIFDLDYAIDRSNLKRGDFNLAITTPDRTNALWKNISGRWDVMDQDNTDINFKMGGIEYTVQGKLTLQESSLVLVPGNPNAERIFLQWTVRKAGNKRDYFLKAGRESKYGLLKLKGTITDYAHVDVEGGFKAGPFMSNEFLFTSKWNKESDGAVRGGGTFNFGNYQGEHNVFFQRDASTRSATFKASGTSNIPDYQTVSLSGNYNFNHKAVLHAVIHANDRESKIDINFSDINPGHSRNTININIPILGQYGQMELTFSHDFTQNTAKSFSAVAKFANRESYVKANWSRNDHFDTLEGSIDIKSRFLGEIHIKANYDVSNIADAHIEVTYTRTLPSGETKNASIKWHRKRTDDILETELIIDSPYEFLKHGRIHVNANFSQIFQLSAGIDYNDKHLTFELDVKKKSITGKITTPFENFELMEGVVTFNLSGKKKTIQLIYERGTRKVNLDFVLNIKPKKEGDFELSLTTPFEAVQNLHIDGKWNKKKAEVNYQRNDIQLNFSGKAQIKVDKSSFDISFSPPDGQTFRIAGSYDVKEFLEGTGSSEKKIADIQLEFKGNKFGFSVQGYRNSGRVYLEIDGQTSFARIKTFHLKLDSELNTQFRDGHFEVLFNDFVFKMHNHYEKREGNGYYFRSQIESTLTRLPALIFGIGRSGEERIITVGYGENKEITFSIKGKNNFRSGFSGYVDIPNFGYEGVNYDIEYGFENSNELHIKIEIELGSEGVVEAHFNYNSEGVEARLKSYRTGDHSVRLRRSVSSEGFFVEAGLDNYNLKLRGGFNNEDAKRGLVLEGEVFGKKFLLDALFQSEGLRYTEGKLIIQTPFQGWEKIGGLFTWSCVNKEVISHAEVLLPSYSTPKITAEINLNLKNKIIGQVSINLSGEEFILKSNLVESVSEGYKGTIELFTPFHSLSYVTINGSFKCNSVSLEAGLNITAPFATHSIQAKYRLGNNKLTANIILQSSRLDNIYNIDLKLKKTGLTSGIVDLGINGNKVTAECNMSNTNFLMNFDSFIAGFHRQFSVEAKYSSLDNLESTLVVTLGDQTHKVYGSIDIAANHVQGTLELESGFIEGKRMLSFDISIPNASYKKISCHLGFVSSQTYSIHFEFDVTSGIHLGFKIDTPLTPKINCTVDITVASVNFSAETPSGAHELLVSWGFTREMPSGWVGSIKLSSPLLPEDYIVDIFVGGNQEKQMLKAELAAGSVKHVIEGYTSKSKNGGSFSFNIETPIKNINRASVEALLSFQRKIEMHISGTFANKINTFNLSFDKDSRKFITVMESPFIPTGMMKAEAQFTGEMNKNMQVKMTLKNNEKTISGIFNVNVISLYNMKTSLKIATPFKGYKKMNFGAQYMKDDDVTILIFIEKPVKFNAELHLGNMRDSVKADLKIDTSIQNFKTIESHLLIPLNTFEPRVSANVMVEGNYYGGHLGVRTKAPYELTYGLHAAHLINSKFHIRTDSSFLSFLY